MGSPLLESAEREPGIGDIVHTLPGQGNDAWLQRMSPFELEETLRQARFKLRHWPELALGRSASRHRHLYPHILPVGHQEKAYYPPVAAAILHMLQDQDIALHNESLNLKSSQTACFNFLFPLRQDLDLAAAVFRRLLPGLVDVSAVEFEYTGPLEATLWMGEPPGGGRGRNRTSVDAVVFWRDAQGKKRITLIEWKYTEKEFGPCGAFSGGSAVRKNNCLSFDVTSPEPPRYCYVAGNGRNCGRRYWDHMREAGIVVEAFAAVPGCPFRGPLYQIMRQQQLAAYLCRSGLYDSAEVALVSPGANTRLLGSPRKLTPIVGAQDTILSVWNRALSGVPPVRHIAVEALARVIEATNGADPSWVAYLRERYGV